MGSFFPEIIYETVSKGKLYLYSEKLNIVERTHLLSKDSKMVGRHFTQDERSFIVRTYVATRRSNETIRAFRNQFPGTQPPTKGTILYSVRKFNEHGTTRNLNRGKHNYRSINIF